MQLKTNNNKHYKNMITKTKTLKLIKSKVDARKSGRIKLKKSFVCAFEEGIIRHTERRRITHLMKSGNSVLWMDDTYNVRNISVLDTKDLHKIMWQLISDKEKMEIALEHLVLTKSYLEE